MVEYIQVDSIPYRISRTLRDSALRKFGAFDKTKLTDFICDARKEDMPELAFLFKERQKFNQALAKQIQDAIKKNYLDKNDLSDKVREDVKLLSLNIGSPGGVDDVAIEEEKLHIAKVFLQTLFYTKPDYRYHEELAKAIKADFDGSPHEFHFEKDFSEKLFFELIGS